MVVVAGEKSVYRCVVASHATNTTATTSASAVAGGGVGSREYREGLVMAYSHVVAAVVDRSMDDSSGPPVQGWGGAGIADGGRSK